MKQLKFRVFEKSLNRFLGDDDHFLLSDTGQLWWIDKQEKCYTLDLDNYVIQLFTGLHDKNNREIYEGDILSLTDLNQKRRIGTVAFDEYNAGFCVDLVGGGVVWPAQMKTGDFEIVGNIFENPEFT